VVDASAYGQAAAARTEQAWSERFADIRRSFGPLTPENEAEIRRGTVPKAVRDQAIEEQARLGKDGGRYAKWKAGARLSRTGRF
jgi:hypothetical protein